MSASKQATVREVAQNWTYCIRRPDPVRREAESHTTYKKGYEVRFTVWTAKELATLRRRLAKLGLEPGRPHTKVNRTILPVYGRKAVELFDPYSPT